MKIPREYLKVFDIVNNSVEKNDKMIFLYSNMGLRDNVRAMYDYFISHEYFDDYRIICSTNDYKRYKKDAPKNVKFVSSLIGVYYFLQAKFCFYCFSSYQIKPATEQEVVNLWHGMPIKRIASQKIGNEDKDYNFFTHILVTSEFFRNTIKQAFKCESRQIMICGQPKTDLLYYNERNYTIEDYARDEQNKRLFSQLLGVYDYKKLIIWLPTYRNYEQFERLPFLTLGEMRQVDDILGQSNSILFVKLHPMSHVDRSIYEGFSNIIIRTQEELDEMNICLYTILKYTDALITDYSSVYFDYLLLNRPIAFTVEDARKYNDKRGFIISQPFDYMPGVKITRQEQFTDFINNCIDEVDTYSYDRNEINMLANEYRDGHNCERVCQMIGLFK